VVWATECGGRIVTGLQTAAQTALLVALAACATPEPTMADNPVTLPCTWASGFTVKYELERWKTRDDTVDTKVVAPLTVTALAAGPRPTWRYTLGNATRVPTADGGPTSPAGPRVENRGDGTALDVRGTAAGELEVVAIAMERRFRNGDADRIPLETLYGTAADTLATVMLQDARPFFAGHCRALAEGTVQEGTVQEGGKAVVFDSVTEVDDTRTTTTATYSTADGVPVRVEAARRVGKEGASGTRVEHFRWVRVE